MFARRLTMQLKPNKVAEFTRTVATEVIPMLQRQQGFQDELVFVGPGATEALAISLWDKKESAETYTRTIFPELLKSLAKVTEGTPQVHTYEVSNSTLHKIGVGAAA